MQDQTYGKALSTVFGDDTEKSVFEDDEDEDPLLANLRFLEYRYMRFWFHPLRDRFMLGHGWKDPSWTNVKSLRDGLDADEKAYRAVVFGTNSIDIELMSIPQLLVNEVCTLLDFFQTDLLTGSRPSILSTSFRSRVWCFGRLIATITMQLAFSLSRCSALPPPSSRPEQ